MNPVGTNSTRPLIRDLANRIVQLELLLDDLYHLLGRMDPEQTWKQQEIDAYRSRIKTTRPRGDSRGKGTNPMTTREVGPHGATK